MFDCPCMQLCKVMLCEVELPSIIVLCQTILAVQEMVIVWKKVFSLVTYVDKVDKGWAALQ